MKRKDRMLKLILIVTILAGACLSGTPLRAETLDHLVQEALQNNPELAAAKAGWEQASYREPQVSSLKDPVLSFAFSNYPVDTLASDETPMTGNELKLSQAFPFPGKLKNQAALAREQANWADAVYRDMHYQLARKVKDAWLRLYFVDRSVAVIERNLEVVDDVIRVTEVRYETGTGLQQDVLKAQIQRSRFMERLMALKQQRAAGQAELNRLLNRSPEQQIELPEALELKPVVQSLDDFRQAALDQRPMSSAYQALIGRYRAQSRLAELDDYPDFTVFASWRFRDDGLPDSGTDFISAGISFNLPIYQDKRNAGKAEALAAIRMAEHQQENFRAGLSASLQTAYARMEETREQAELYSHGIIPQASQGFQAALSSYQVGKLEFISLLDALMATYQAEMDYYRISSEYMRSLAWLEAESTLPLTGAPLQIPDRQAVDTVY